MARSGPRRPRWTRELYALAIEVVTRTRIEDPGCAEDPHKDAMMSDLRRVLAHERDLFDRRVERERAKHREYRDRPIGLYHSRGVDPQRGG